MSEIDSNIDKNKRLIFKNPDGYKSGERDSSCETKAEIVETNNTNQNNLNLNANSTGANFLYLSDDDLRYLIDTASVDEYPIMIDQLLDIFRKYRLTFTLLNLFEMFLTFFLTLLTWQKRETAITIMEEIYKDINTKEAAVSFYFLFFLTLGINLLYYPLGFYAIAKKNVRLMKFYSFFIVFNAMFILISIYINILFVFSFVFRLLLYGFSKFLYNLLIALLILPIPRSYNNYESII